MKTYNTAPYFDDFDENNKFYKILFRPGFAVQARELTQLQTSIQNQIKSHGDHVFKDGSMVIPGQMSIDTGVSYVKLQQTAIDLKSTIGLTVVGSSGLSAQIIFAVNAEESDPATLFIRYTNSGDNNETKVFADNEILTINSVNQVQAAISSATGVSSIASIERGVYYVKGYFVLVDAQTIALEKYNSVPTYRVGLEVSEKEITPEEDERLLDNALGSYNYAAPGAHRYYIDLTLIKKDINSEDDENFIELLRVENGSIKRHVNTTEYSEIEKTLARRTYDESGNYTVRPFNIDVREHRSNDRGDWASNKNYLIGDVVLANGKTYVAKRNGISGSITPIHTFGTAYDGIGNTGVQWEYNQQPFYNRGIYTPENDGDESKLAIGLEPGKAYVEGYEIEKISTEYVSVNKSRNTVQVDNAIIPATVGNYVLVTGVNNLPPINSFGLIDLYNRFVTTPGTNPGVQQLIGRARVRFIEWHDGTIGTSSARYKLGLFDIKMNPGIDFNRDVKSFHFDVSGNARLSFSANVSPILVPMIGSVSVSNSTAVIGSGTSFQTTLKVGDYISFGSTTRRVVSIESQNRLTIDSNASVSGESVSYVTTNIEEPNNLALIYQLPYYAIKSVRSAFNTNDTTYTVYQRFTGNTSAAAGGLCTLTISTTSGTFASAADLDNYIVVHNNSSTGGTIVNVPSANITASGQTVTFRIDAIYSLQPMVVIAAVNKSGSILTEKSKTLVTVGGTGTVINTTNIEQATATEISLRKADCYRLVSVKMATGTFANPGDYSIDITDRYDFDNGQRDTHYDVGRIKLKASYTPPIAPIQIQFEYFSHSEGDYFTVNSYGDYSTQTSNTSNIAYSGIPFYNGVPLSDCIDFRPRISDNGIGFTDTGASISLIPKRSADVRADFTYHLARKTKIAIDFNGKFFTIDGVPSVTPGDAPDPSMGMILYDLTLEPYTFGTSSNSVLVNTYDNKRYTMRDIGKLEKRIDNLEYYTSLSLLEQQTESLDIIDSDGLNRFKNGFIVDGFTGHNTGDVNSPDYLCAIDMERGELRPFFSMNNVNLMERATNNSQRVASNYKLYGDVITLPVIDEIPLIKQEYASRLENINPFAIFTFLGNVVINPSSDDWFEVERRPDIVNQVEGNFNTVKTLAEKAGVLGTVWNAWQTQWTGVSVTANVTYTAANPRWGNGVWANVRALNQGAVQLSFNELQARFGTGAGAGAPARQVTVQTTATQVGQQRTGVRTSLVTKIDRQVVADRVLSTAVIPYIRSRNILIQVKGLKPNTRFFPYFDNINVQDYCTPASRLVYTPITGEFDDSTNVGGLVDNVERKVNNDTQVCLNRGDVIRGSISNATAVVIGKEYNAETNTYALYVANIKGTFSVADTLSGNISNATGRFVSLTKRAIKSNLVSNFNGDLQLLFRIPNDDKIRFRTGTREFKLIDSDTATGEFTSRGRANYRAEGILETKQATVNAVRNAELVQEQVVGNRVIVQTSDRVVADTGWYDPLAQTFLVQNTGGAFLTKIDIFFATKDSKVPVNLEIREVVNGYPGKTVLPFSRVSLKPEQVNLSDNTVILDGVQTRKYDTATSFVFPSPVYVQDNQEYAIVLSSDSNNYKVWISQLGDDIPGSSRTISEQPYNGVFFKSQNASTWTADQLQDLKFTIYRAKFATNTIGNVEFVNSTLPLQTLDFDPFETRTGSKKIRVYQRNHGMPFNSRVVITNENADITNGVNGTGVISTTNTAVVNGINNTTSFTTELKPGSVIYSANGLYIGIVKTIESNTAFTLVSLPQYQVNFSGFKYTNPIHGVPTTEIYTTHTVLDVESDSYCIQVNTEANTTGYTGGLTVRCTRNMQFDAFQPIMQIQSFPDTDIGFEMRAATGKSPDSTNQQPYQLSPIFNEVSINENNEAFVPYMVASDVNESNSLGGEKSLLLRMKMSTTNDSLSPILDTHRTSFIVINNKVNNPTEVNSNVGGLDDNALIANSSDVTISGNKVIGNAIGVQNVLKNVKVGKYMTIRGSTAGESTVLITEVAADGTSVTLAQNPMAVTGAVTLIQREYFVDEISPNGSSTFSKYVTKQVNLANTSMFIRIRFAAYIPYEANVDVYYRTSELGSTSPLEDKNWTLIAPDSPIVYAQPGNVSFTDITYSSNDITAFNSVQVKLVMKSSNTAAVPLIKDLRVIACA